MPSIEAVEVDINCAVTKFDLELDLYEQGNETVGYLSYSTALFDRVS